MELEIAYGKRMQKCVICDENIVKIIFPKEGEPLSNVEAAIKVALNNPIGLPPLIKIVRPNHKVVFVIDDATRPTPTSVILKPILEILEEIGVSDENILIIFALGVHKKMSKDGMSKILGKNIFNRYRSVNHEAFDNSKLVDLGVTKFGTPVSINKEVIEADIRILTGMIKPHNLAGYSGGAKSILPGVCGVKTIMYNHSFKTQSHPYSKMGILEKNPLRKDIEETLKMIGPTFMVNLVLDYKKNICKIVAGDCIKAHREGARFLDTITKINVFEKADICICGTPSPTDVNVYQMCSNCATSVFRCPHPIIKDGGILIISGEASEGISDGDMYDSIVSASSINELYEEIKDLHCEIHERAGVQHICELLLNYNTFIVANIKNERKLENMGFRYFKTIQEAYDMALALKGKDARVTVLPYATCVIPDFIKNN